MATHMEDKIRILGMNIRTIFTKRCGIHDTGLLVVYDTCTKPVSDVHVAFIGFRGLEDTRSLLWSTPVESGEIGSLRERIQKAIDEQCEIGVAEKLTDAVFREVVPDVIRKQSTFGSQGPSAFRDDAAGFLAQHAEHGIVHDILAEWCIDGPGNWIFQYETEADVRIACVGRNGESGKIEIKWDNPA